MKSRKDYKMTTQEHTLAFTGRVKDRILAKMIDYHKGSMNASMWEILDAEAQQMAKEISNRMLSQN